MLTQPHPLGVLPEGNALLPGAYPNIRGTSLGPYLSLLSDALVLRILTLLPASSLCSCAEASRFLYALSRDEDIWRALVLTTRGGDTVFRGTWRHSYAPIEKRPVRDCDAPETSITVKVPGVYSDVLFHKHRCATASIRPLWLIRDNVPRESADCLSLEAFRLNYEAPRRPVVIKGLCERWGASKLWSPSALRDRFAGSTQRFICGGYKFTMNAYLNYADAVAGHCDQPLYLFDSSFARTEPSLADDYVVPEYFADDLFRHLGEERRPAYRWLIIGPAGSGSSFHVDPNSTSAWNACVSGSKKWILFPPGHVPPGVFPSEDSGDVTAPLSVLEWYTNFYEAAAEDGALECTVRSGEVIFVPAGWWHAVLNLEWTAAVTQNYAPAGSFNRVAKWLQERPEQVSGREKGRGDFAEEFVRSVKEARPEIREMKKRKVGEGLWDQLKVSTGGAGEEAPFTFGLG